MENKVYYKVYRTNKEGKKELVATYVDVASALDAAHRYNTPHVLIQIEKTSKP